MILADAHRDEADLSFRGLERLAVIGEMMIKSATCHTDALAVLGSITVYQRGLSHGHILHCPQKDSSLSGEAPAFAPAMLFGVIV